MAELEKHDLTVLTSPGARTEERLRVEATVQDWGPRAAGAIAARVAAGEPDAVVVQYVPQMYERRGLPLGAARLLVQLRRRGLAVATMAHEVSFSAEDGLRYQPYRWLQRLLLYAVCWGSAAVVVTVPRRRRELESRRFFRPPLVSLLPVSANLSTTGVSGPDWRARHQVPATTLLMLFMGLPHPNKEIPALTRALDCVAAQGFAVRLAVVGGVALGHPLSLDLGYLEEEDAAGALAAADMFLLPLSDGASGRRTSLMNALAAGLPTVSSLGADTDRELFPEASLRLVPAGDTNGFGEAVAGLARDREAREAMGESARRLYQDRLDWPVSAKRWTDLLSALARARGETT